MFANIFTATIRERYLGVLIGALAVCAMIVLGVGVYGDMGDLLAKMMDSMPAPFLAMMGMTEGADPSSFVLAEMMNLIAPMVLAGLAISMGTHSIAGEERKNTLEMLLGNPRSRTQVLLAKAGSMATLVLVCGLLLYGGTALSLALMDASPAVHLGAAVIHLIALGVFFGSFAIFVGALTGQQSLATATSVGLLVVSWLAANVLPLIDLQSVAYVFPWYYFSGSRPLHMGVEWSHVAVLAGLSTVLLAGAVVGVRRRDLRFGEGSTLFEMLRNSPRVAKVLERLGGGTQVSSIRMRTVSEMQTIAGMVAFYTALLAFAFGPMYNSLSGVLKEFTEAFPQAVMAMIGFADMSTPEGWYVAELFSLTAPGAIIVVVAMMGTRALAGEESRRTMSLLLCNPIPRWRVVLEKATAIAMVAALIAVGIFVGTAGGNLAGGLGMSYGNIAAASVQAFALGLLFGMVALAASAARGTTSFAVYVTSGAALVSWALNAFLPVNPDLAGWARISPFYYYMDNAPLESGLAVGHTGLLLALSAGICGLAVWLFERRDLRG